MNLHCISWVYILWYYQKMSLHIPTQTKLNPKRASTPVGSTAIASLHFLSFPPISHFYFNIRLRLPPEPVKIRSFSLKCMLPKPHITKPSASSSTADSRAKNSNRIPNAIGALLMYDHVALAASGGRRRWEVVRFRRLQEATRGGLQA